MGILFAKRFKTTSGKLKDIPHTLIKAIVESNSHEKFHSECNYKEKTSRSRYLSNDNEELFR